MDIDMEFRNISLKKAIQSIKMSIIQRLAFNRALRNLDFKFQNRENI